MLSFAGETYRFEHIEPCKDDPRVLKPKLLKINMQPNHELAMDDALMNAGFFGNFVTPWEN